MPYDLMTFEERDEVERIDRERSINLARMQNLSIDEYTCLVEDGLDVWE